MTREGDGGATEVLLAHLSQAPGRDLPDAWTLPGGGLEHGEHPSAAAVREVTEETGLTIAVGDLLGIDSLVHESSHGRAHALRIVYRGTVTGGRLRPETDGSTDEAAWIPLPRLGSLPLVELARTALAWAGLTVPGPSTP
ncbi:NUDIX hydrolase [Litorihabitans aurantiacus]|uniref:NUDIX hydrolase n=1 Tax=Litorihabitans aurantiacus TaxID=1930061 RepID=UPI0024E0DA73|nr:NUDIX domain-containing protein [Litorihabitans aurantiacus]